MNKLIERISKKWWNEVGYELYSNPLSERSVAGLYSVLLEEFDEKRAKELVLVILEGGGPIPPKKEEDPNEKELDQYDMLTQAEKDELKKKEKDLDEDTWVKNKKSGNVYTVKKANPETHVEPSKGEIEKAEKEKQDKPEGEVKAFSSATAKSEQAKLAKIDELLAGQDDNTLQRAEVLKQNWDQFVNAKTREERVQAVRELADNNLIEGHAGGKKIYLSPNSALPYKHLTGASGTSVSEEMNKIIQDEGIEVPMRGGAKDRALADMSGKHNEAGVVSYLFPSDENKSAYESTQKTLKELGGDEAKFDAINKKAADIMKASLPDGSQITGAQQVGGVGRTALAKLGIDPKIDPTDLIIQYKDKDGNDQIMKVSAKTYTDPKNITMKNSGVNNAGANYLGDIGKDLDAKVGELRKKYAWNDSMSDQEKADQKKNLKQAYLGEFSSKMEELSKTKEGQQRLTDMWKDVHGCGQNVHTQVINKKTGDVQMKSPDHYCNPTPPFGVKFDGVKLVINMGGKDDSFLQVDMKTEDKGSPKILFRHRTK
jgi:uncharacterized protein YuzE